LSGLARRLIWALLFVVTFVAIGAVVGGGIWCLWTGHDRLAEQPIEISLGSIERIFWGMYLQFREAEVQAPVRPDDDNLRAFIVEMGEPAGTVSANLEREGLVTDGNLFKRLLVYLGIDQKIEAGEYYLRPNMTMEEIAFELQRGRSRSVTVTIPEGWRAEQIAQALESQELVDAQRFIEAVQRGGQNYGFLRDRPPGTSSSLEGFLFPDTYQIPAYADVATVLDIMLGDFDTRVTPELRSAIASLGKTLYEVVTVASIVEREAVLAEERPVIASVYLNRLKKGMYLQADPTVQYAKGYDEGSGRWWAHMLQEEAATVESPYNTFLNPGLPPGPICNPGLAAIEAVVYPAQEEYLFFYSKGDGSHAFAVTYEEHLQNQAEYQR
jgi:UPF0755 protein